MNLDYNDAVPATNDNPSNDQPDMLINTASIGQWVNIDHYGFGSNTGGQHQQCTLISQAVIPPSRTNLMGTLYSKQFSLGNPSGRSNLFYTPDATGLEYQMTRCVSASFSTFGQIVANYAGPKPTLYQGGWTFLPGGLYFQYGEVDCNGSASYAVTFPIAFFGPPIEIILTPASASNTNNALNVGTGTVSTTGFTALTTTSAGLTGFTWLAIGL